MHSCRTLTTLCPSILCRILPTTWSRHNELWKQLHYPRKTWRRSEFGKLWINWEMWNDQKILLTWNAVTWKLERTWKHITWFKSELSPLTPLWLTVLERALLPEKEFHVPWHEEIPWHITELPGYLALIMCTANMSDFKLTSVTHSALNHGLKWLTLYDTRMQSNICSNVSSQQPVL